LKQREKSSCFARRFGVTCLELTSYYLHVGVGMCIYMSTPTWLYCCSWLLFYLCILRYTCAVLKSCVEHRIFSMDYEKTLLHSLHF
jgi:hypothetical protein